MRSMISTSDSLEILVNERGCGEVPLTVECDQRHQDSQIVNRQRHEPEPWLRKPITPQGMIFVALIYKTHGSSLENWFRSWSWTPCLESRTRRTGRGNLPGAIGNRGSGGMGRTASVPRLATGAGAGSSDWSAIASWKKPSRTWV